MQVQLGSIIVAVLLSAAFTRFLRQAEILAGFRLGLVQRIPIFGRVISCPHCLSFWLAIVLRALLAHDLLNFGIIVLLGWRGAFFLNRLLDATIAAAAPDSLFGSDCQVCGASFRKDFLERRGHLFCSYRCWFDFLKAREQSFRASESLLNEFGDFVRQEIYPMSYKNVKPGEAKELLDGDGGYTYIDVRSQEEYESGHPSGAVNVPVMHRSAMGMVPNAEFLPVMDRSFDKDDLVIIGCQSVARSIRAAEGLVAAGFTNVVHMDGGFGGTRNELGEVIEPGWAELGLPVDHGSTDGGYEQLHSAQ